MSCWQLSMGDFFLVFELGCMVLSWGILHRGIICQKDIVLMDFGWGIFAGGFCTGGF